MPNPLTVTASAAAAAHTTIFSSPLNHPDYESPHIMCKGLMQNRRGWARIGLAASLQHQHLQQQQQAAGLVLLGRPTLEVVFVLLLASSPANSPHTNSPPTSNPHTSAAPSTRSAVPPCRPPHPQCAQGGA